MFLGNKYLNTKTIWRKQVMQLQFFNQLTEKPELQSKVEKNNYSGNAKKFYNYQLILLIEHKDFY